mmetsp:Transcript_91209/g.144064  ORF Transcript_91209/g.144064 Transcript_91209/m.144064 type:complete len:1338 (+) Transcript_91209:139-4152(+)
MAVTSFDGSFSFKQDSLARLGDRGRSKPMNDQQREAFNNSPFMQGVRKTEERCWDFTVERDRKRAATDPTFKPSDNDFSAAKNFPYDKAVDYYQVLGIDEYASLDEVKKAYKKLSLIYHPDKSAGLTQEEKDDHAAIFIEIKNAYQTLNDQATRRQYDRERDRDKANFELNGHKPKKKAHFNAQEVLKNLLENQKPPGKMVNVHCAVKLEKFFYGGHKAVVRDRRMKTMEKKSATYRIDVPPGAKEPYECVFRGRGDFNADTLPDSLTFQVKSKPHELVERRGDDLVLKKKVLFTNATSQPYLTLETPSVNGRHILLWGRNPFYSAMAKGSAELHVRLLGEGLTDDSSLRFTCTSSLTGASTATSSVQSAKSEEQVLVTLRNLQTEAKIFLSVKKTATIGQLRQQAAAVLQLSNFSGMRILQKLQGESGYTPYSDAQKIGSLREFAVAGITFNEVPFNQERHISFLQAVVKLIEKSDFQRQWATINEQATKLSQLEIDAQLLELWQDVSWVMPEFGLKPTAENLRSQLALATTKTDAVKGNFVRNLLEKINKYSTITANPVRSIAKPVENGIASSSEMHRRRGLKAFLRKHGLGPRGGFDRPGSDTEDEILQQTSSKNSAVSNAVHGQGGHCDAKSIKQRSQRLAQRKLSCELELSPISDAIHLFTKPSCSIKFYSNSRQSLQAPGGTRPRLVFAFSLSAPMCAKGKAKAEWNTLKDSLLPVLRLTAFHFFQAARQIAPKCLPDFPAFTSVEHHREVVTNEDLQVPWKRLADVAFKQGDYFTAMIHYSRCISDAECCEVSNSSVADWADSREESAAELVAVMLSNRAACFAKVGHYQESLQDARRALEKRPKWGKAWSRVGLAASCLGKAFEKDAIEAYSRAVEFDPSATTLEALHAFVLRVMQADADAAHSEKEKGNQALRNREVGLALACYTVAIALVPKEETTLRDGREEVKPDDHVLLRSVLYSNRCGALCMLRSWDLAIADGRKAIAAKSDFEKAHSKLGTALLGAGLTEQAYTEFARALYIKGDNQAALSGRQACLSMLPLCRSLSAKKRTRNRLTMDLTRPSTKIYAISDVFFDHRANEDWAHSIDDFKFAEDVLIVAGNMCDSRNALMRALVTFKAKFRRVFYVPGNHEMSLAGEAAKYPDSFAKLLAIFDLCDELGVDIAPAAVCKGVFIVPLLSWYNCEFDTRDPFPDFNDNTDQHCRWPMDKDSQVWKFMLALNASYLQYPYHGTVITFSHFIPRSTLFGAYGGKTERKTSGCLAIDEQARLVGSKLHVYGHTRRQHWGKEGGYGNGDVIYANHYHGKEDEHASLSPPLLCVWNGSNLRKQEVSIS